MKNKSSKILFFDIETSPILAYVWGLFDQNIALNQIHTDWQVLAWAAKWSDSNNIIYKDARNQKDDKSILKELWVLLNEADIVVTQNGKKFDSKKINARFVYHGLNPPVPYKHIDTLQIAKKYFAFTSNKLAYTSEMLCPNAKKSDHKKYPGFELWKECLRNNPKAWAEMKKYNIQDVIALEKLYEKLRSWDSSIDRSSNENNCRVCDSHNLQKRGINRSLAGTYQRYQCIDCGAWTKDAKMLAKVSSKRAL